MFAADAGGSRYIRYLKMSVSVKRMSSSFVTCYSGSFQLGRTSSNVFCISDGEPDRIEKVSQVKKKSQIFLGLV